MSGNTEWKILTQRRDGAMDACVSLSSFVSTLREHSSFFNWCFWIMAMEKTLRSPLDCKEIKPVNLKENQPWIFIGQTVLKLKFQYFGCLMWRVSSLEKTLMPGKTEGKRRSKQQRLRWLGSITGSVDVDLSKFWEIVEGWGACHATVHGVTELDVT